MASRTRLIRAIPSDSRSKRSLTVAGVVDPTGMGPTLPVTI